MVKKKLRKLLVVTMVIFLFGTMGIVQGMNVKANNLKIEQNDEIIKTDTDELTLNEADVYVDDDAPQDWYDEIHVKTIQEGVDNATVGDSIFVYNGIYYENVIIRKKIYLNGENNQETIIHCISNWDDVVRIFSDEVEISNFTIENSSLADLAGPIYAGIQIYANKTIIKNNILKDNLIGIEISSKLYPSCNYQYNKITDNLMLDNGIQISGCSNNIIRGNTFINVYSTIWDNGGVFLDMSNNNIITRNNFSGHYSRIIILQESDKNDIHHNNLQNGFRWYGIAVFSSNSNRIHHNNFIGSSVKVFFMKSTLNICYRNYWGRPRILPKMIFNLKGILGFFPLVTIDPFPKVFPNKI